MRPCTVPKFSNLDAPSECSGLVQTRVQVAYRSIADLMLRAGNRNAIELLIKILYKYGVV